MQKCYTDFPSGQPWEAIMGLEIPLIVLNTCIGCVVALICSS